VYTAIHVQKRTRKREREREKEREVEKAWIIGASSNRRPSQTSPFTLAYSTFLQPPPTEDQKERTFELFHLRLHLFCPAETPASSHLNFIQGVSRSLR